MDNLLTALIAFATALTVSAFKWWSDRSNNEKSQKNELKEKSYIDFIDSISELAHLTANQKQERRTALQKLAYSKSRISIYGDNTVIDKLAAFDKTHKKLDNEEAYDSFVDLVYEMRLASIGSQKDSISKNDLKQILFGLGV